jgi:acetolactate synthase-1/2/3 large subunit
MWAAQSIETNAKQRFLTSGGLGSMGFGLPAAIGACFASNNAPVVLIAGDGGFQCNLQELQTVARNRLPIKIVILNNHCHGMVRQFQDDYFGARHQSTRWGYDAPAFARLAEAYGIQARHVQTPEECTDAMVWLWSDPQSPALLEIEIGPDVNAYPKMAFGRPLREMEPFARSTEMEST